MWERRVGLIGSKLSDGAGRGGVRQFRRPLGGPGGTSLEKTSLTVAALPIVDDAPLFLAIRKVNFRQQGLTVTPKIIAQSTLALPDLLHGSVDIVGGGNYVSYFGGQAKGTFDLRVLVAGAACLPGSFGVVAMPSSHITKAAGLAGKTIAVNLTSNIQTLMTNVQLKAAGVSPSSVKYVAIPFPDMGAALKAGRVAAIRAVEPFLSGAESAGAKQVVSDCAGTRLTCRCPDTSPPRPGPRNTRAPRRRSSGPWRRPRPGPIPTRLRCGRSCPPTPRSRPPRPG